MRRFLFATYLMLSVLVLGILWLPLLISSNATLWGMRMWAYVVVFGLRTIVGVRIEIRGREHIPTIGCLVAAKHQSMLDTIVPLIVMHGTTFILKKELLNIPFYGWHSRRSGMIPVDRAGHSAALKSLIRISAIRIKQGRQIVIFPEGTRKIPGDTPDYKPGVAALYRDLNVPCVPLALNTGLVWPQKGWPSKPGVAIFEFLPAIAPGLSRLEFMRTLETQLEAGCTQLISAPQTL